MHVITCQRLCLNARLASIHFFRTFVWICIRVLSKLIWCGIVFAKRLLSMNTYISVVLKLTSKSTKYKPEHHELKMQKLVSYHGGYHALSKKKSNLKWAQISLRMRWVEEYVCGAATLSTFFLVFSSWGLKLFIRMSREPAWTLVIPLNAPCNFYFA